MANALAILVLAGMLLSLGYVGIGLVRTYSGPMSRVSPALADPPVWQRWLIPALVLVGLAMSGS